jgi:hypothetical protein
MNSPSKILSPVFALAILAALYASVLASDPRLEFVGFTQPLGAEPFMLTWKQLTTPASSGWENLTAGDVAMTDLEEPVAALGAWQDLDLGFPPKLTCKILKDQLVCQINTGRVPTGSQGALYPGGCCADTLRVFDRNDDDGGMNDYCSNSTSKDFIRHQFP